MSRLALVVMWLFLTAPVAAQSPSAQRVGDLFPEDARIIETANVPVRGGRQRELVLWMRAPRRVMTHWEGGGDFLYGDHWLGPTFLSLVDPSDARLINTIPIHPSEDSPWKRYFALPFRTLNGPYYVPHPDKDGKGKPVLLHLKDFTGEGVAGQFALFSYVASAISEGSVQGYSSKSDMAVQYRNESTVDNFKPIIQTWAENVFDTKPSHPGYWKFTWNLAHGSNEWIDEEMRFDSARQRFVEKQTTRPYPEFEDLHCRMGSASLATFLGRLTHDQDGIRALEDRIRKAMPNSIDDAELAATIQRESELLDVAFQSSASGSVIIDIRATSKFAAVLRPELTPWCGSK